MTKPSFALAIALVLYIIIALSIGLTHYLADPNLYVPSKIEWGGAEIESVATGARIVLNTDGHILTIRADEFRQKGTRVQATNISIEDTCDDYITITTAGKATFGLSATGIEGLILEDNPKIQRRSR